VADWAGVVAADVPRAVRAVHAVPADPGGDPARRRPAVGVLPGGVALQVRQQALHALIDEQGRPGRPSGLLACS